MLLKKLDRSVLEGESIVLFRAAIRSKLTLDPYERRLVNFLRRINMTCDDFVTKAKENPTYAERQIVSLILEEKKRLEAKQISPSTISNSLKAIRLLLEMNDVSLNWKKIRRILPRARRYALDRIPTVDELRKIIDASDVRGKALTYVLLSSGIREGAVEDLNVGHLTPIKINGKVVAGRLVIYARDPEQYVAFITTEAYKAVEDYLEYRKKNGEIISPDSPLFRDRFDVMSRIYHKHFNPSPENPVCMTTQSIRHYYNRLFRTIGIRSGPRKRHEFSIHSFRKWFKTKSEQTMKPINIEILMGHSVGISDSYYRPTEKELLEDYMKAQNVLTVSQTEELKHKLVEKARAERDELKVKVTELEAEIERIKKVQSCDYDYIRELRNQKFVTDEREAVIVKLLEGRNSSENVTK